MLCCTSEQQRLHLFVVSAINMQSSLSVLSAVLSLSGISETLLSVVSAKTPARLLHDATHVSSVTQPEPAHTAEP